MNGLSRYFFFLFSLLLLGGNSQAQVSTIRLATWNLLNWPIISSAVSDSTGRCPHFRTVLQGIDPDILVTQENSATYSTTWFLNCALNYQTNQYRQGSYIHGYDTNNGIFYKDSLFRFVSNQRYLTTLRDINLFTLIFKPTDDTLRIFSVHLKASTGSSNEAQRAAEADTLRKITNGFPAGTEFIVCGDFNIYGDYESAYQKLVQVVPGKFGHFNDPIFMPGVWNHVVYARYHTQSTRLNQIGGGAGGGVNDRFDMILYSDAVAQPGGLYFVSGSVTPYGNDAAHYNQSINNGTNAAVPAAVANSLYFASDHLPVYATFEIGATSGISNLNQTIGQLEIFPNPGSSYVDLRFKSQKTGLIEIRIMDLSGKLLMSKEIAVYSTGDQLLRLEETAALESGLYILQITSYNTLISRKLLISK